MQWTETWYPFRNIYWKRELLYIRRLRCPRRLLGSLSGEIAAVLELDGFVSPAGPVTLETSGKQLKHLAWG